MGTTRFLASLDMHFERLYAADSSSLVPTPIYPFSMLLPLYDNIIYLVHSRCECDVLYDFIFLQKARMV